MHMLGRAHPARVTQARGAPVTVNRKWERSWVSRGRGARRNASFTGARARDHAEDLVDLGHGHVGLGLVGGHDEIGRQLHFIEELVVFEAHVKRIHAPEFLPLVVPGCLPGSYPRPIL